jgi:hypothetical protein
MLRVYDRILLDYFESASATSRLIVATGLTQVPYDKVKFYYRLVDHKAFLNRVGIAHQEVHPRMTRDFEVVFADRPSADAGIRILSSMSMEDDGLPVFGEIEDRGNSIFVTLTYPKEIKPEAKVRFEGGLIEDFAPLVAFVAIKNGMHSTRGFAFVGPEIRADIPRSPVHVSQLFGVIVQAAAP